MTGQRKLTFEQVQEAMKVMIDKSLETPATPTAMAVVDEGGHLLAYATMDGLNLFARGHIIRKAYTAATTGKDSAAHAEARRDMGVTVAELGDPNLSAVGGGVVARSPEGYILGAISAGGYPSGQADEDLARLGLNAMNL